MIQRYLKTTFFLFALFAVTNCVAQNRIYPFEDYSKCQVGFMRKKGDTLYAARFENLKPSFLRSGNEIRYDFDYYRSGELSSSSPNAWILSENNRFGCLSIKGDWVIPCKYDALEYDVLSNYFKVQLTGMHGLISSGDTVVIPIVFDEILPHYLGGDLPGGFLVKKNNLTGLYSIKGKEIIPPVYESIERIQYCNWETKICQIFYVVEKDGLEGILAQNGSVVIEPLYKNTEFLQRELDAELEALFRVENTAGDFSVFNSSGKQLLPFKPFEVFPVNTLASVREKRSVSFVERIDTLLRHQVVSLTNGKESDWYEGANFIGDQIFTYSFQNREEWEGWEGGEIGYWQLLDSNFNLIYSCESIQDRLHYFGYNSNPHAANHYYGQHETEGLFVYLSEMERLFNNKTCSSVYVIQKTVEPTQKQLRKDPDAGVKEYISLLNGKTGIRTPFIYQEVLRVGGPNQICFWGIRLSDEFTEDELTVDVYDSTAAFIHTVCLDRSEIESIEDYCREGIDGTSQRWSGKVVPVQNLENLMGAVRLDGTRVISNIFEGKLNVYSIENDSTGVFVNEQNRKYRFYDFQGQPLLNGITYDHFVYFDGFTTLGLADQFTLVLPDLSVELDSCSKPYRMSYKTDFRFKAPGSFWTTERKGYLYGFWDNHFHLLNSETFVKPNETVKLSDTTFLDFNGKIQAVMLKKEPVTERYGQIFLTLSGTELKVENEKHKTIQIIKNVYKYEPFHTKMRISMLDNKEGLLDLQTGQWILKPIFQQVDFVFQYRSDCFWAKDSTVDSEKWFIVSAAGKPLTEAVFDTIFLMRPEDTWQQFYSNGKFGFVNTKFEIATPAIFDDIIPGYFHHIYASGNKYYLVDKETGKSFQIQQDYVVSNFIKDGHLFLFSDSIRILGLDGKELVAPMKLTDAMATLNLRKYLFQPELQGQQLPCIVSNQLYCSDADDVLRRVSNNMLIENVKGSAFAMKNLIRSERLVSKDPVCSVSALWVNPFIYSEATAGDCFSQPLIGNKKQDVSYRSYSIDSAGITQLQLADLFVEGYEKRLDEAIAAAIQKQQVYGTNCADLPKATSEFKRNFYISKNTIIFLNYGIRKEITVDLSSLKDLLKHREYFPVR